MEMGRRGGSELIEVEFHEAASRTLIAGFTPIGCRCVAGGRAVGDEEDQVWLRRRHLLR
jgi:hypothetical protein